jgi:polar amino acid transport system substrate-binding protein
MSAAAVVSWSRQLCAVFMLALMALASLPTYADTLDQIKARGKLVVGVKKDVLLWGYMNPQTNRIEGFEPDLAKDLATRLGVQLELVGLLTAERISAVESRQVDVLIATLSDTPERRARLNLVEPHYYSSGVNIVARKAEGFKAWSDLRNRRVCGRRGAFYNRPIAVEYGADIVALYGNELAKTALRDGRCSAFLFDDTSITALLTDPLWSNQFGMPLPTLYPTPWSVALHATEAGGKLEALVSSAIIDWHRSGSLKQLERKWAIPPAAFVSGMNTIWNQRTDGRWFCGDKLDTKTPKECR